MSFARPAPVIDWAASSDDENENIVTPGNVSPIEPQTEAANRAAPAMADDSHTTPEASPVRALDFSDRDISPIDVAMVSTPPVRVLRSQEMRVDSAVPYTFKSVWSVTAGPATHNRRIAKDFDTSSTSSIDRIHNRACEQLTSVLRAHSGRADYSDLMKETDWRVRFQPCFGSLFSFLKRNKNTFRYSRSAVELVEEEGIVSELLKVHWRDLKALAPSDMILASTVATTKENTTAAAHPTVGVRSYSAAVKP